jgi:hypothetical protein
LAGDNLLVSLRQQTVHIQLLDEAVDVWAPVNVLEEANGIYHLPHVAPADES